MKSCICFIFLLLQVSSLNGRYHSQLLRGCHLDTCEDHQFNCECEKAWFTDSFSCIPSYKRCDGWKDCEDGSDELDCKCPLDYFQCGCNKGGCSGINDMYYCVPKDKLCDNKTDCLRYQDELNCTVSTALFRCSSGEDITSRMVCDGQIDCVDGYSDETNCIDCPRHRRNRCECNKFNNMTCQGSQEKLSMTCFSDSERCDGRSQCADSSDENNCTGCPKTFPHPCNCNKPGDNTCSGYYFCYKDELKCNGISDCSDGSDEQNCSVCPKTIANRCACNRQENNTCLGWTCYSDEERCDGTIKCSDGSDETSCMDECSNNDFVCNCLKTYPPTCKLNEGCISNSSLYDGKADCPDNSDESDIHRKIHCGSCNLSVYSLKNVHECNEIGFPRCDNKTCYNVSTNDCPDNICENVICTSHCENISGSCDKIFQCSNGKLFLQYEFCNHETNCPDGSDEIRKMPGFKCRNNKTQSCVLPQQNLFDNVDHCGDGSDICNSGNNESNPCFRCLDGSMLIANWQVCNGIIDCTDLSDECFCVDIQTQTLINSSVCVAKFSFHDTQTMECVEPSGNCNAVYGTFIQNATCGENNQANGDKAVTSCLTQNGPIFPNLCDGRPECRDFSDECNCNEPPSFCDDVCRSFYPLGDRYCDGIEDEQAWKYINNTKCPKGFDERDCPKRFKCAVGNRVSIDISQNCDGIKHCDDGSDEANCPDTSVPANDISSDKEMIASLFLRIFVWLISFITLIGNTCVILYTVRMLKYSYSNLTDIEKCSRLLMLNLSCADFLMGIYLLIIAIKSAIFSGIYGEYDSEWRASGPCRFAGSLAIFSSETSCFIMTIMTGYRLYNVYNPFNSYESSRLVSKWCLPIAWILSFVLAIVPNLTSSSNYFAQQFWFPDISSKYVPWNKDSILNYACRLSTVGNYSVFKENKYWESAKEFLTKTYSKYNPRIIGYYGETSVCLPRFYVKMGDSAWEYSLMIITINFLSFFFVAISYSLIYYFTSSSRRSTSTRNEGSAGRSNRGMQISQSTKIQKRIARLIFTDFLCWMPICIMAFLRLAGVDLLPYTYAVSAIVLLPINSALNPLLYTKFRKTQTKNVSRSRTTNMTMASMTESNETMQLHPLR